MGQSLNMNKKHDGAKKALSVGPLLYGPTSLLVFLLPRGLRLVNLAKESGVRPPKGWAIVLICRNMLRWAWQSIGSPRSCHGLQAALIKPLLCSFQA